MRQQTSNRSSRTQRTRLGKPLDAWSPRESAPAAPSWWNSALAQQAVIVTIGAVVFFTNLGSAALFDMDEALYATCAREMAQRGDWVVPWFNGQMFPDKPPLMYWLMMLGRAALGPTELAVRLHSALFGIATALATYHLGRLLFRREVGFWAGVIVSTSIVFTISARAATVDSALTFAITAAVLAFVAAAPAWRANTALSLKNPSRDREGAVAVRDALDPFLPKRWFAFALMYALIGVAVLAKGPVGLIMPLAAVGLFLLVVDRMDARRGGVPVEQAIAPPWPVRVGGWLWSSLDFARRFTPARVVRAGWRLRPLTALLIVGAIALPWYVLVGMRTEGRWLEGFLKMNLGPATKAIQGHTGPWFYHLLTVFIGFFPWSVFLGPMLVAAVRRVKMDHAWRPGYVLALCWTAAVVGLWSAVAMKLPHHILPAYPALALLAAAFVYGWIHEPAGVSRWWMRNASITFIIVGLGIAVALPLVAMFLLPGEGWTAVAGAPLIIGGAACWWLSERNRRRATMTAFTAASVAFLTVAFGFVVLGVDRHQNGPAIAAALNCAPDRTPHAPCEVGKDAPLELATFRFFRESFVYYTGSRIERMDEEKDLDAFLARSRRPFIITTNEHEAAIRRHCPDRFHAVLRRQRFLDKGRLVVLEWEPTDGPRTAAQPNRTR